jgi:hypothetical protein
MKKLIILFFFFIPLRTFAQFQAMALLPSSMGDALSLCLELFNDVPTRDASFHVIDGAEITGRINGTESVNKLHLESPSYRNDYSILSTEEKHFSSDYSEFIKNEINKYKGKGELTELMQTKLQFKIWAYDALQDAGYINIKKYKNANAAFTNAVDHFRHDFGPLEADPSVTEICPYSDVVTHAKMMHDMKKDFAEAAGGATKGLKECFQNEEVLALGNKALIKLNGHTFSVAIEYRRGVNHILSGAEVKADVDQYLSRYYIYPNNLEVTSYTPATGKHSALMCVKSKDGSKGMYLNTPFQRFVINFIMRSFWSDSKIEIKS